MESIAKVRSQLASLGGLSPSAEGCLDRALLRYSQDAGCLPEKSWLAIRCEEQHTEFVSGREKCSNEVSYVQELPWRQALLPFFDSSIEWSPGGKLALSVENLDRVKAKLLPWSGQTDGLKSCLEKATEGFSKEPRRVQRNARMLVRSKRLRLEFVSGAGATPIHVFQLGDGNICYSKKWNEIETHLGRPNRNRRAVTTRAGRGGARRGRV